jgi:hypothetical protein
MAFVSRLLVARPVAGHGLTTASMAHLIFRQVNSHRIDKNPPWTELTTEEIFKVWASRSMKKNIHIKEYEY